MAQWHRPREVSQTLLFFLRVHWCATPPRCTAQMTACSSTRLVESWAEPCRRASRWRFWERTTAWRMRRTHRSALSDACGFLSQGDRHTLSFWLVIFLLALLVHGPPFSTTILEGPMSFLVVEDLRIRIFLYIYLVFSVYPIKNWDWHN